MMRFNFFMPGRMYEALKTRADTLGLTLSEVVRRAIDAYLAKDSE